MGTKVWQKAGKESDVKRTPLLPAQSEFQGMGDGVTEASRTCHLNNLKNLAWNSGCLKPEELNGPEAGSTQCVAGCANLLVSSDQVCLGAF